MSEDANDDAERSRPADDQPGEAAGPSTERPRRSPGEASAPIRKAGSVAYQSLIAVLVLGLLIVVSLALGFLVFRGAMAPGPFLLLVGILVGFSLGRLDAIL